MSGRERLPSYTTSQFAILWWKIGAGLNVVKSNNQSARVWLLYKRLYCDVRIGDKFGRVLTRSAGELRHWPGKHSIGTWCIVGPARLQIASMLQDIVAPGA